MNDDIRTYLESRHKPQNINIKHKKALGSQDKLALLVTGAVGSMYAVYIFATIMIAWIIWQTFIDQKPFDPYPFAFLLFLGNLVQLLLMPLIMVGQNLQSRHTEIRAEEEYQTTNSSYHDIEQILLRLDKQDELIKKLINQLDVTRTKV